MFTVVTQRLKHTYFVYNHFVSITWWDIINYYASGLLLKQLTKFQKTERKVKLVPYINFGNIVQIKTVDFTYSYFVKEAGYM